MDRCVVLNGDYTFLNTIDWQRAICLVIKGTIEVLKYGDRFIGCADGSKKQIPSVIKLLKVIRTIYRNKVPFSNRNMFIRDKYKCVYCGSGKNLTIDHMIPTSQGGKTNFENCVTACTDCNSKKRNRTPSEAKMYPNKLPYAPTISEFFRSKMKQLGVDVFLKEIGVY